MDGGPIIGATEGTTTTTATTTTGLDSAGGTTAPAPCETGAADSTTGVQVFDDAYTFTIPLPDGLCVYPSMKYTATAWRSCGLMEPSCPMLYGEYAGETFECEAGGAYPAQVSVTVHAPGWYMPGLTEAWKTPIGEGEILVTDYHCFAPVAQQVTEDDYNDVTERIMDGTLERIPFLDTNCREYCSNAGGCQ